jgi:hypothetical protein
MNLRIARVALWAGLGAALAVTAYLLVNTTFMPYDDEGYVLISLRNYLAGLRLYDDVFSQYGPWPYIYHELVTGALQADITHTLGRALTVFHWVAMALLCGVLGWRLTLSQVAGFVSAIVTFGLCWQNASEPSHPGSHITVLVALAGIIVSLLPETRRPWSAYAGLGVITGLLLLTKINIGLLLAAGVGCFVLCHTPWPSRWRRSFVVLGILGVLAVPWVLLGRQLGHTWVLVFAVQFTLAAAGILWVSLPTKAGGTLPSPAWIAAPLACLAVCALLCFRIWLHGTSMDSLVHTILINPLRMPANFIVGVTWYPEVWGLTIAGVLAVGKAGYDIRTKGRLTRSSLWIVAILRIGVLVTFLVHAHLWPTYFGIFHFAAYCLSLLPVFLVPLADPSDSPRQVARTGVTIIAALQVLHAFPVAGSQLAWGTFLSVPILISGLYELRTVIPILLPTAGRHLVRAGGVALLLAATGQLGLLARASWGHYTQSRPLALPGAHDIRLDGKSRQSLRLLSLNAGIHADLLFSRQGMFSHNLWSGVPTPTAQNATQWFWLLNEPHQREIASKLASTPRTALINSHSIDQFMVDHKIPVGGPLQDFVQAHYRPLFRYGDFTFHVPTASRAIPFGRFELLEPEVDDGTVLFRSHVRLEGRPVRIRLELINFPWDSGPDLLTSQTRVIAEPINPEGQPAGEPVALPSRMPLHGLYRLSVICPRLPPKLPWQDYLLLVEGPDGARLSESVY